MKERYMFYAAVLVFGAAIITSHSSIARAITPTGPGLEDGSGTYLGQLLGTNYDEGVQHIHYVIYVPSIDGIVQLDSNGRFENIPDQVLYEFPGCTGKAYVYANPNQPWINPWIVAPNGGNTFYKVASSTMVTQVESVQSNQQDCQDTGGVTYNLHRLRPVTLPFDPNTVTLPYKITP
ncbi:MAG: hypothetical protein RLZZ342_340 [Candidatus Parcubacteria bacterium]|jgi:hypothetical protein